MHVTRVSISACFFLVLASGCRKPVEPQNKVHQNKIDACSLITAQDVGAIQITSITDTKSSASIDGGFRVSQCYYSSAEPNKSVSLSVTQANPDNPSGPDPLNYWEQTFGPFRDPGKNEKEEEEEREENRKREAKSGKERRGEDEEERIAPPKKISGVGQEAYWSGNRFGGALYVLEGDVFIRISVGGADNEETKINKSKALAQKAIERL